jgi:uncharacterized protein
MTDPEPVLITSRLSRTVTWEGRRLQVEIYRLATDATWTLEVVNDDGTSIVWDDPFASDRDADEAFRDTLAREGVAAFFDKARVFSPSGRLH